MKKEEIAGLIVYMFIIAVAIVYSLTVLRAHFQYSAIKTAIEYAGFVILALLAGIFTSALLLELGHMAGAKAGKYSITSVCILYFTFFKEENKWKFKFKSFDGLTGETKVLPKDKKSNPTPFLILGTLFLAIWAIACFVIFYLFNGTSAKGGDLAYFFLTIAVVVLICLLYNILPIKLDSRNDGYSLRMLSNPQNKLAYNEMLSTGKEVEIGNNEVEIETYTSDKMNNYTAELNMNKAYVLLDKKEFAEADKILDIIIENKDKVSNKVYLRTIASKIFIKAMSSSVEESINYLNETINMDLRRDLSEDKTMMSIRAYILLEGLTDNSKSECMLAINKVNSAFKSINKNRRISEATMYNDVIDFINKVHPKWEFEQYKIDLDILK